MLTLAGVAILVAAGAGLFAMLAVQAPVAICTLLVAIALTWHRGAVWPRLERRLASMLFREALPIAISLTLGVIYLRVLVILCGFLTTTTQTGYFGTSFRAFEVLWSLPTLMLSAALPVLSVAGRDDRGRLAGAIQTMTEAALIVGLFIAIAVALGARPLLIALGGDQYAGAASALQDPDLRDRAGLRGPGLATRARRGAPAARARDRERRGPRRRPHRRRDPDPAVRRRRCRNRGAGRRGRARRNGAVLRSTSASARLVPRVRNTPRILGAAVIAGVGGALIPDPILGACVGSLAFVALVFATRSMPPELLAALAARRHRRPPSADAAA